MKANKRTMMTHRDRFLATIERREVDRPAFWLGIPHPDSVPALCEHFGADTLPEVRAVIGDDICSVALPWRSENVSAIYEALQFSKCPRVGEGVDQRTLTAPGFFENCDDLNRIDAFDWPNPKEHIDPVECKRRVENHSHGCAVLVEAWSTHFQDTLSAFGMENALIMMLDAPLMVEAVADRITEFYLAVNKIMYEAAADKLDAVLLGNDVGGQEDLLLSPDMLRRFMIPGMKRLVDQAHDYGVKVVYHSCGAIRNIIEDFIAVGIDALHPIQANAQGMQAEIMHREFAGRLSFVGGVDTQWLLPCGTPGEVSARVRTLRDLFPTGLVISPSHEALLPDVPPVNIEAMCQAVT
jgi:uroporphyrinogen decarboxylase